MSAMPARTPQLAPRPITVPVKKKSARMHIVRQIKPALRPVLETLPVSIPKGRATNRAFALFIVGIFTFGLLLMLVVNNLTATASFQRRQLQIQVSQLIAQQQQIERKVAYHESPGQLIVVAHKMGMVPAATPAFLRLSDHKILGVPQAADAGQ